jgi:hypothetical protein
VPPTPSIATARITVSYARLEGPAPTWKKRDKERVNLDVYPRITCEHARSRKLPYRLGERPVRHAF